MCIQDISHLSLFINNSRYTKMELPRLLGSMNSTTLDSTTVRFNNLGFYNLGFNDPHIKRLLYSTHGFNDIGFSETHIQ